MFVYTIQPVVKPVVKPVLKPVWQPVVSCIQTFNRLGLTNGCNVCTAGCQTGCTTRFDNRLNEQWVFVQHGCQTGCQTRLTTVLTTGCIVYTNIEPVWSTGCRTGLTTGCIVRTNIQPVVKLVVQPPWQPVVSYKRDPCNMDHLRICLQIFVKCQFASGNYALSYRAPESTFKAHLRSS